MVSDSRGLWINLRDATMEDRKARYYTGICIFGKNLGALQMKKKS